MPPVSALPGNSDLPDFAGCYLQPVFGKVFSGYRVRILAGRGKGAEMYTKKRQGLRVGCDDKCLLVCNGRHYPCKLENISVSGVLLRSTGTPFSRIKAGDTCGLVICSDPMLCPGEYRSKVARLDASRIALQFIDVKF